MQSWRVEVAKNLSGCNQGKHVETFFSRYSTWFLSTLLPFFSTAPVPYEFELLPSKLYELPNFRPKTLHSYAEISNIYLSLKFCPLIYKLCNSRLSVSSTVSRYPKIIFLTPNFVLPMLRERKIHSKSVTPPLLRASRVFVNQRNVNFSAFKCHFGFTQQKLADTILPTFSQ